MSANKAAQPGGIVYLVRRTFVQEAVICAGSKKAAVAAFRKADFASTRGKFSYNTNHFPIQNFYLLKAVAGAAGQDPVMEIQKAVFTNHKDSYSGECKMKW